MLTSVYGRQRKHECYNAVDDNKLGSSRTDVAVDGCRCPAACADGQDDVGVWEEGKRVGSWNGDGEEEEGEGDKSIRVTALQRTKAEQELQERLWKRV